MTRSRALALVTVAHLVVLLACHGFARAADAPPAPTCSCVSCDLDGSKTPNATVADYAAWSAAFGSDFRVASSRERYNPLADFDRSGSVTTADWSVLVGCCPLGQPRR